MHETLIIKGQLPSLNEYTRANRAHRMQGAQMKADAEQYIGLCIRNQHIESVPGGAYITFTWFEPNKKRDLDNICFAKKFILDALVKNGVLDNDGWKGVIGFTDYFYIDKQNPRIEVEISNL